MNEVLREIGSGVAKLRSLLADSKKDLQRIRTLQDSLSSVLSSVWESPQIGDLSDSPPAWKEFLSLVASGRVLSVAAQADGALAAAKDFSAETWLADGHAYSRWLGRGVVLLVSQDDMISTVISKRRAAAAQLCGKSFGLGYQDDMVEIIVGALLSDAEGKDPFQDFLRCLAKHEQRQFLHSTLNFVSKKLAMIDMGVEVSSDSQSITSTCANLLKVVLSCNEEALAEHLSSWLTKSSTASTATLTAAVAALPQESRDTLLERSWQHFGDKLTIRHTPIIQQETNAKLLLVCTGFVHQATPMQVFVLARSSIHTDAVSDRLSSSSPRVRSLGMMVGVTISDIVDKPESRLKFDFQDSEQQELKSFKNLLDGPERMKADASWDLLKGEQHDEERNTVKTPKKLQKPFSTRTSKPKIAVLEETKEGNGDKDDDDEDDLEVYEKPDSDAEDSDEDATIARKQKPKTPAYIRDLITMLEDTENFDQHHLALITGPSLIRRKADFGSELKDRIVELASIYTGLNDHFNLPDFHDLRLQGTMAILISQPQIMGPWLAEAFFSGDYSVGQRAGMLTAIGLSGRELAGLDKDGEHDKKQQFPSKTLPDRLHSMYAEESDMNALAKRLQKSMITRVSTKKRTKLIKNDLARIVTESFFFPLTGRFQSQAKINPSYLQETHLLSTYLQTLSILLTAAGPSTVTLPQLTSEYWDLLLSLRSRVLTSNDSPTLEAILFGFLTLLNVNEDKRRLAQECSREVIETHEWTNTVFENVQGGDEEGERVKMLASGVLVATKEVSEKWRALMIGDIV